MNKLSLILILSFFPFFGQAQSQRILDLEKEALGSNGILYVDKMIQLADWYLDESLPDQAIESATKGYDRAREFDGNVLMAKCLNREAKGWLRKTNFSRAIKRLQRSQKLLARTQEKVLPFDNAYTLLLIAQQRGRDSEIQKAENQIAILKEQLQLSQEDISELRRLGLYQKIFPKNIAIEKIAKEKQALSSTVEDLKEVKDELTEEREKLEESRIKLESLVKKKQGEITKMTESQAKAELLFEKQKHLTDSLAHEKMIDSLMLVFSEKDLKEAEFDLKEREMALKEQRMETELKQTQRNFFLALTAIGLLLAFGMFLRFLGMKSHARVMEEKNKIIKEEKERSEDLLLNILPLTIANELKEHGEAKARRHENVSVLFADFKNFSKISKLIPAEELIRELDICFKAFDEIVQKFKLEKIKTIGDAYMCAGGLPIPNNGSPTDVVRAALEMQQFLMNRKLRKVEDGKLFFEARIGIHTGPIIAGVVGLKKFTYDIWGDTVNVASRMESGGTAGKVNISGTTYEMVKKEFNCEYRGKVPAKNIGEVDMYYVE